MPADPIQAMEFAQSKGQARREGTTGVTFADVAGLDDIQGELQDIVSVSVPLTVYIKLNDNAMRSETSVNVAGLDYIQGELQDIVSVKPPTADMCCLMLPCCWHPALWPPARLAGQLSFHRQARSHRTASESCKQANSPLTPAVCRAAVPQGAHAVRQMMTLPPKGLRLCCIVRILSIPSIVPLY